MIDYQIPQLSDRAWAEPLLYASGNRGSENNFTNIFVWQKTFGQRIARWQDFVMLRYTQPEAIYHLFPAGEGDPRLAVAALLQDAAERGERLKLIGVSKAQCEALQQWYPEKFDFTADRDGFDYVYEVERLASLQGKKLQAKRNHINRFVEQYPEWQAVELTPENLPSCMEVERQWAAKREQAPLQEDTAVWSAIRNFEALGLEGLMILTPDGPAAFTMGKRMSEDTYDVHFEKADGEIQGAYAIVNREFARLVKARYPQVRYLNREDDMGLPGLRKAKESYHPDLMVEKYRAVWKDA